MLFLFFVAVILGASTHTAANPITLKPLQAGLDFLSLYGDKKCEEACGMLSGYWYWRVPVPPYPTNAMNSTACLALCKTSTDVPNFCTYYRIKDRSDFHEIENTGVLSLVFMIGTKYNDSSPLCAYGLNDNYYVELDNQGKISALREFYDPAAWEADVNYCTQQTQDTALVLPPHPAFQPEAWTNTEGLAVKTTEDLHQHLSKKMKQKRSAAIDDSNATALCLGMMGLYSQRRCEEMTQYVASNFSFHFTDGPEAGFNITQVIANCAVPNPPEYQLVQQAFSFSKTEGTFWDYYGTAAINKTTGDVCSLVGPETYRCSAVQTKDGLRLDKIVDDFDPNAYDVWAKDCLGEENARKRWVQ
eukprot:m.23336 g.23336  ORF g.23336 m.23336 type:complete len:359 (-) comp13141_c0_seq1:29-1105(-)